MLIYLNETSTMDYSDVTKMIDFTSYYWLNVIMIVLFILLFLLKEIGMDKIRLLVWSKKACEVHKEWKVVETMSPHLVRSCALNFCTYSTINISKMKKKSGSVNRPSESPVPVPTLVRFASLSYCKPAVILRTLAGSELKHQGWICFAMGRNEGDGYFGAAFWQELEKQLVIVHRGTVNLQDAFGADLEGIINRQHTSQIHSASLFASLVVAHFENVDCDITITGHSLGGWLSPLSAFEVKYLKFEGPLVRKARIGEEICHPYVVTFDAPGCLTDLGKLLKLYFDDNQSLEIIDSLSSHLINYCITPNLINTTNSHIGKIRSLKKNNRILGFDYHFSVVDRALFSLLTHSFDSFVYVFEKNSVDKFTSYEAEEWPKKNRLLALLPSPFIITPWKMIDNILLSVELVCGIISRNKIILQFEIPFVTFEKSLSDIDFTN